MTKKGEKKNKILFFSDDNFRVEVLRQVSFLGCQKPRLGDTLIFDQDQLFSLRSRFEWEKREFSSFFHTVEFGP